MDINELNFKLALTFSPKPDDNDPLSENEAWDYVSVQNPDSKIWHREYQATDFRHPYWFRRFIETHTIALYPFAAMGFWTAQARNPNGTMFTHANPAVAVAMCALEARTRTGQ